MSYKLAVNEKDVYFNFESCTFSSEELDKHANKKLYIHSLDNRLSKLYILVTNSCNLQCKYCFANCGTYENNRGSNMIDMDTFRDKFLELQKNYTDGIDIIQFFGGEPLLNYAFIIECIQFVNEYCNTNKIKIPKYSIVTNGVLLSDSWYNELRNYHVFITISLDGTISVNDSNRFFVNGKGSFQQIYNNIIQFNNKEQLTVEFSISDSLIEQYYHDMAKDIIEEFRELGFQFIITNIIYSDDSIKVYRENYKTYKKFINDYIELLLKELFSEQCQLYDIQLTNLVINILSKADVRNTCTCGVNNLTMNTDGQLLTCSMSKDILFDFEDKEVTLDELRKSYCMVTPPESCQSCSCQKVCSAWCRELDNKETMPYKCTLIKVMVKRLLTLLYSLKSNKADMKMLIHNIKEFINRMG